MIDERDYARLLGYPPGKPLEGDIRRLAEGAARWYRCHGRPRVYSRDGVVGLTAGWEVDEELDRLWAAGRVDEAYFLDRFAAALVEHLASSHGATFSPGHRGFPLEEQFALFEKLTPLAPEIELLSSGMLRPRHSLLALFDGEAIGSPCSRCDLARCRYRRAA